MDKGDNKVSKGNTGAGGDWDNNGGPSKETMNLVREVAVTPMVAGFFQGFFTVAMRYRREQKAAEKAADTNSATGVN